MSAEERVALALGVIDGALEASTDDLLEGIETPASLYYAEGMRDGIRLALEKVREVLAP